MPDLADGALQGERGCQGVGACKLAIRQEDDLVGTAEEAIAQDVGGLGRAHCEDGDGAAGSLLDLERHLERVEVLGIEDGRQGATVHGAVFGHHVAGDVVRVGDLLHQDHAMNRSRVGHQISGDRQTMPGG